MWEHLISIENLPSPTSHIHPLYHQWVCHTLLKMAAKYSEFTPMCECWLRVGVMEKITVSLFTLWTCKGQPLVCSCSCYLQRWGLWDGILRLRFIFCPVPWFEKDSGPAQLLWRWLLLSHSALIFLSGWRCASSLLWLLENSGKSPSSLSKHLQCPRHSAKHFTCIIFFHTHKTLHF